MLHITVIANEKKKRKKTQGGVGVKKCIGKGLWGLVEERKRREGKEMREVFEDGWSRGKRKDGIRNRSGKRRRSALRGHRCVPSLALFLLGSAVCARHSSPPPPLQRTERARRESQSAGQSRGPKRKSNKTWSAFIICPPYIVCHRPAQTSGGRQKQPYACKHKCAPEKSSK